MQRSGQWFIPILLAVGAAAALWYYWAQLSQTAPEPEVPQAVERPETTRMPGPLHPLEPTAIEETERPELVPLPPLDQSDEYLKLELASIFGDSLEEMLADSGLIERVVATVDNLPRSHVAERIRPVGRLGDQFLVIGQDGSGAFTIDESNYRRYDALVSIVTGADLDEVTELYRRYYPLFQSAYVELGYPDGYFNDRLVEVIDHLLETPEVGGPVTLVRPHVLYEFDDPALESLSSGQKLLLRMGEDHAASIKTTLRSLREKVTSM